MQWQQIVILIFSYRFLSLLCRAEAMRFDVACPLLGQISTQRVNKDSSYAAGHVIEQHLFLIGTFFECTLSALAGYDATGL